MAKKKAAKTKSSDEQCVVVGVGASAGGLDAYKRLLQSFPTDAGIAFVLVQHLDPHHESMMVELLQKHTEMPVSQVEHGSKVEPNHVYMIPPNKFLRIGNGDLFLDEPITKRGVRLPIDYFFQSLAEARKERAICIVLSGTGSDGSQGLREVKAAGGLTVAQKPRDAQHDGMPRSAMATGVVDFVLPIEEMPDVVIPYARHPYVQKKETEPTLAETSPDHFKAILDLLRTHTDQNFGHYKTGTLTRRIERRMSIHHLNEVADYLKLLRSDVVEIQNLYKDMLIGVTRFYRDEEMWSDLKNVLSGAILEKTGDDPLRVWVPGCSSGEEAYSIAMTISEQMARLNKRLELQVFATDIDTDSIDIARAGIYSEGISKDIPDAQIDTWFHRDGDKLRIRKKLRESCIFAVQNLLADPPFSNLDLISCRNVLIYLESEIQQRLFEIFHFALRPSGILILGTSESPASRQHLFETVSKSNRIYKKVGEGRVAATKFPVDGSRRRSLAADEGESEEYKSATFGTVELSRRALLEQFAPASVVVDQRGMIQYIHGPVRNFMDFPSGEPNLDLAAMVMNGLKARTRHALTKARTANDSISVVAPRVRRDGGVIPIRIRVQPLPRGKDSSSLFLVSFFEETSDAASEIALADNLLEEDAGIGSSENQQVVVAAKQTKNQTERTETISDHELGQQLALELQATREDLQSTIEELESANEELKASNEEVMSMNEELQSTNEELETSREELQSLNEELSTVNNQLHDKVDELESTTNDLTNLLASTDMATLFLDEDLRIRRYTPATERLMNLIAGDIGRPLSDLATRVHDPDLVDDAKQVLDKLTPIQKQVRNGGKHWYLRTITPFRTSENRIEGVVILFSDVTELKLAADRLKLRERQQAVIAELGEAALSGDDLQTLFNKAVEKVADTLGFEYAKILQLQPDGNSLKLIAGVGWHEGLVGTATVPAGIDSQAGFTLQQASPVVSKNLERESRFSGPELLIDHDVVGGMSVIIGPVDDPWGILGTHSCHELNRAVLGDAPLGLPWSGSNEKSPEDAVTNFTPLFLVAIANVLWEAIKRRETESTIRKQLAEIDAIYDSSPIGLCFVDTQLRYIRINNELAEINGTPREEHLGKTVREILPGLADEIEPLYRQVIETGEPILNYEISGTTPAEPETQKFWLLNYLPLVIDGKIAGVNTAVLDITERRKTELELDKTCKRLQHVVDTSAVGIGFARDDGTVTMANDALLEIFDITREQYETEGWDWQDRVLPEDQHFAEIMKRLGNSRSTESVQLRRKDSDHDLVWVLASAKPLDDGSGEYVAFLVDITKQKEAEIALAESQRQHQDSETRLEMALSAGKLAAWEWRPDESFWTDELYELLGISTAETASSETFFQCVHPEDRDQLVEAWKRSTDHGLPYETKFRIVRPNGQVRWVEGVGEVVRNRSGEVERIYGLNWDATRTHELNAAIQERERVANLANEAKSEFLANMSHEIRTPMSTVIGYADILARQITDPKQLDCIDAIRTNGKFLLELINDILDISRIEAGKLDVDHVPARLDRLVADVYSMMDVRAGDKNLNLNVRFDKNVPQNLMTDDKRLKQILVNLLGNAIKFTDEGSVDLAVHYQLESSKLVLEVIDTGIGIQSEKQSELFQPFSQADSTVIRQYGGSGLGLTISQRLAEKLAGEITIDSTFGHGSTFRVTVTAEPCEGSDTIDPENWLERAADEMFADQVIELTGRFLVVDDRREVRYIASHFIQHAGGEVVDCENGLQAIETVNQSKSAGQPFDMIIMDMQMPLMDGYQATRRLRSEGFEGPIVALTGQALQGDRAKCLDAGCTDYVTKPLDKSIFLNLLSRLLDQE